MKTGLGRLLGLWTGFLLFVSSASLVSAQSFVPFNSGVSITFDDSHLVTHTNAFPYMNQFGIKGTFYTISGRIGTDPRSISWAQAREIVAAGHEIGDHTLSHLDLTTLDDATLSAQFVNSKALLESQLGIKIHALAFPFGAYDQRVIKCAASNYESTAIVCWEGDYPYNLVPGSRYEVARLKVHSNSTPQEVIGWINQSRQQGMLVALIFHDVITGTTPIADEEYPLDNFKLIMDYIAAQKIPTPTITQALVMPVGTNIVLNPGFEKVNSAGWASNWRKSGDTNAISLIPVTGANQRVYSPAPGKRLQIVAGPKQNIAYTDSFKLTGLTRPWGNRVYVFQLFAEVNMVPGGRFGIWVDEFDSKQNYVSGQEIDGFTEPITDLTGILYHPTSDKVAYISIDLYSEPGTQGTAQFDSVYFSLLP